MVNLLMQIHPEQSVRINLPISPPDIPISNTIFPLYSPAEFLSNFLNDRVLGIADVDNNFFGPEFVRQLGNGDNFGGIIGIIYIFIGII